MLINRLGVIAVALLSLPGCGAVFPRYTALTRSPSPGVVSSGQLSSPPETVQRISFRSAEAPPSRRDGARWDTDGPPDLYAVIYRNDQEIYRTPVVTDQSRARWPDTAAVNLSVPPGSRMRVELWDDDGPFDDVVGRWEWIGMPASALRGGVWTIAFENGGTLHLEANPPPPELGMGITYELHAEYAEVLEMVPGGPAERAGISVGDRITAIDHHSVLDLGEIGARQGIDRGAVRDVSLMVAHGAAPPRELTVRCDAVYTALKP